MNERTIVSAFPGTGKSHFCREHPECSDSDSSKFDKSQFPANYIEHIKQRKGLTFVSSHKVVRDAMVAEALPFTLCYPDRALKEEYLERYRKRQNTEAFVKLLDTNWDAWITELEEQKWCGKIVLKSGQYLLDFETELLFPDMINTADTVYHSPTGETWVVAFVDRDRLAWCGWPEGLAELKDCTLIEKATADAREKLLHQMAASDSDDSRVRFAKRILGATNGQHGVSQQSE